MRFRGGNHIQLLRSGAEYFPALEYAILHAQFDIYIQTYIYEADAIGVRIGNALISAVKRGVNARVLIDGFGSKTLSASYIDTLRAAGVDVMFYRPKISPWTFKKNRLRRLHQKVTIIDSQIAFVGGINIIDDANTPNQVPPRIDYAVRIEGPLLPVIASSVHKLWQRLAWMHFRVKHAYAHRPSSHRSHVAGNISAAYVIRDNILHRRDIETAYLTAIQHAKSEVIIANAYFVPGIRFRRALISAAKRGVKVKLLLQGRKEYFLMFAVHAFYGLFLKSGIEIYEYRKSFMHSKVAVIDSEWSTVGSSNIDPFSLFLAREANIIIRDQAFSTLLRADIIKSIEEGAMSITSQHWQNASIGIRFISWVAYGIVRFFLGIIGNPKA
ncbi:MAG: cardiolipin synthase ClsB [Betaproteobacteria bacterium HGW-Betaproteobacteria-22]|nr:MAG: cardiolipin synthase ClsB [Betaproteobacteria bacterium HGW-Betaproteobacteria-22]